MKLFSKNKAKLLKFFYAHPEKQFYIQEIARLLGKKAGVFQRALNNLYSEGLLTSEYKANARFFKVNEKHPIYQELRSIIAKSARMCLVIALIFTPFLYAQDESLTLKGAITEAFLNNKDIRMQEREIEAARADILGARSNFLPDINFDASYIHRDKVLTPNIFSGYRNDNTIGLSANETLYNGGANIANLKQAQLGLLVQQETLRAKKLDVEFEAKRLYYGLLLAYETERIARELVGQAQAHYEDVKHKFDQGTSSRFDLLQSKVQVSLLTPQLVQAQNSIKLIQADLNKLLARKVDAPIEAGEKLVYSQIEIREDEFLKTAYLVRPEISLKNLGIDIDKWGIQMAGAGYRPQIDLSAGLDYRSGNTGHLFNPKQRNWNAGVSMTVPIFDGFSSKAKVDAAKARYAQAKLGKENLVDQIAVDIRQACLNLKESETIINSQKDNVFEAHEALRISEVSYENGVAINLDVLDAQVSLGKIQQNLAEGIYDYLMAQAQLDRGMGKSFIKEAKDQEIKPDKAKI